uniref:Uncharacterized protein n=1 Tax=Oryza nivara TaxID=4536 RepID=A0A0E0HMD7_ORYNI
MVKWFNLAFPKDFGGVDLTETRALNAALLAKWLVKIESHIRVCVWNFSGENTCNTMGFSNMILTFNLNSGSNRKL